MGFSQVGVNTEDPKTTMHINATRTDAATAEGVIYPRLTEAQLISKDARYNLDHNGAVVFVTDTLGTNSHKTAKIVSPGFYYYEGSTSQWQPLSPKEPWKKVGTSFEAHLNTDNIYQRGKVVVNDKDIAKVNGGQEAVLTVSGGDASINGLTVGRGKGNSIQNTVLGSNALAANTSGSENVVIGTNALSAATSASRNVAIGYNALSTTNSSNNTVIGNNVLPLGSGGENVVLGTNVMTKLTTGRANVAIGVHVNNESYSKTGTLYSVGLGYHASAETLGVAIGSNVKADAQSAISIGEHASVTETVMGNSYRSIALGHYSTVKDAINVTALGPYTQILDGSTQAVVLGSSARVLQNSLYGVALGTHTEVSANVTGGVALGAYAKVNSGANQSTALGYNASVSTPNTIVLGSSSLSSIRSTVTSISSLSDARVKTDVRENVPGLSFIEKLRPVTYHLDLDALAKIQGTTDSISVEDKQKREREVETGFVAQEVEKAAKEVGYDFNGVRKPENDKDIYSVGYAAFVPSLVKAIQEQQKVIEIQSKMIEQLQKRLDALEQK